MKGYIQKRKGPRGTGYLVRVDLGPDPATGRRRQPSRTYRTRKEAETGLVQWLTDIERGIVIDTTKMTLGEYLGHWLETYARHNVRPTTLESYARLIRVHIIPAIGSVPLQKIQPVQVQAFYSAKLAGGRGDGREGGLSPRTVCYLHTILREALQQAVKWQMVARNVADAAEPPRAVRPALTVWSAGQVRAFLKATEGDWYAPAWLVALSTGLRRGELLGLRWDDVDLAKGILRVRRSLVVLKGQLLFQEPKTRAGRRSVALSASCVAALKEHRRRQTERRLRLGEAYRHNDLVFCTEDGGLIHPRNFYRRFTQLVAQAGLPAIPLHGLRHTHATLLLGQGVHAKVMSERLGHATIGITLDTYSHVLPEMQRQAADTVDAALFGT